MLRRHTRMHMDLKLCFKCLETFVLENILKIQWDDDRWDDSKWYQNVSIYTYFILHISYFIQFEPFFSDAYPDIYPLILHVYSKL